MRLVRYARLINSALQFRLEEQPDSIDLIMVLPLAASARVRVWRRQTWAWRA